MTHLSVRLAAASHHLPSATTAHKASSASSQSFADQLSQAFAETLSKFGIDPGTVKLTVEDNARQTNAARQNPVATAATSPAPDAAPMSPVDFYWSKQPAAVQQLRHVEDFGQRTMLAAQLSAQGYPIDVPVMVWGWDVSRTTQLRQSFGYTWIPSAMQPQVSAAPGISGAAIVPYDPAHPPAGSILV